MRAGVLCTTLGAVALASVALVALPAPAAPGHPPERRSDPVGIVLERFLDGRAIELAARPLLDITHTPTCTNLFPQVAERLVYNGRVVAALDAALPQQEAFWCFAEPFCVPGADGPRPDRSRGYFERALRLAAAEVCDKPFAEELRVQAEAGVRLGVCPTGATLEVLAALPPVSAQPDPLRALPRADPATAADPVADVTSQLRRDAWIDQNATSLEGLPVPARELLALDLARAHLERVALASALMAERDPWQQCGPRPASTPFVLLAEAGADEASLALAATYADMAYEASPTARRVRQLVLLARGDCASLLAKMDDMPEDPKSGWLRSEVQRRWPAGCPAP